MVRSGFGGGSNTYTCVVSGCEDSQVYIRHKLKGGTCCALHNSRLGVCNSRLEGAQVREAAARLAAGGGRLHREGSRPDRCAPGRGACARPPGGVG